MLFFCPKEDPNAWKYRDNSYKTYEMCQEFVKDNLKSPSSAVFPETYSEIKRGAIKTLKDQEYIINSYVDSQNSFGAMIRTHFIVKLKQVDESHWRKLDELFI